MYQYNLDTPWDISTARYGDTSYDFESAISDIVASGDIKINKQRPTDFYMNADGSKIFVNI